MVATRVFLDNYVNVNHLRGNKMRVHVLLSLLSNIYQVIKIKLK